VIGPSSDLYIKKRAASCERLTAPFSKQESRNDFEALRPSLVNLATFRPFTQGHFENFTQSNSVEVGPADSYGYGRGFAVRGNGKSFRPAVLESAEETSEASLPAKISAEAPLLDILGKDEQFEHIHPNRVERRKRAKLVKKRWVKNPAIGRTKRESVRLLRAAGYAELADKVARCGVNHLVKICKRCQGQGSPCFHGISHTLDPCDLPYWCPDCAKHRAGRAKKRYTAKIQKFADLNKRLYTPVLITLTIRSGFDLEERADVLFDSFRRLRNRGAWRDHIVGAIGAGEITFNPEYGFHPHIHIIGLRKAFWDIEELQASWVASTRGEGQILDIRAIKGELKGALNEVLKYVTKPADIEKLSVEQVHQLVAFKRQMMFTLGKLRGFEVTKADREKYSDELDYDSLNCLVCNAPLNLVLFSAEELERMSCVVVTRGP